MHCWGVIVETLRTTGMTHSPISNSYARLFVVQTLHFLYKDEDIFALYKPAGIHSVKLPTGGGTSIADLLLAYDSTLAQASRSPLDAGLVQRLDYETSGVILGAFNRRAWDALFENLMSGEIRKRYAALVEGELAQEACVSTFIGSPHRGAQKVKIYTSEPPASARALPGTTTFTPLQFLTKHNATLVQANASPARRHQVRAHAAFCGHALVGDTLYGSTRTVANLCTTPRTFFLHAWTISLIHPTTQQPIELESDFWGELSIP
jgi:23S rRNA pseudouridine1911/1915/1917 synthase